jgi:hypothetical protein
MAFLASKKALASPWLVAALIGAVTLESFQNFYF